MQQPGGTSEYCIMDDIFADHEKVVIYGNDIMVIRKTEGAHNAALMGLLQRAQKVNLKLGKDKI